MSEDLMVFRCQHVAAASGSARPAEAILRLACTTEGAVQRIAAAGEIDLSTAHLLVDLVATLARTPVPLVAVDLSAVTFFGAQGISALVRARLLVAERGGRLTLSDPSPVVRRVLDVTGLLTEFEIDGPAVARPPLDATAGGRPVRPVAPAVPGP
jgi:anti-sigma B factor antagonist